MARFSTYSLPRRLEARWPALAGIDVVSHVVLRVGAGLLFMQHGAQKLFGVLGGLGATGGTASVGTLMWVAGILETVGGLFIVIGLLTRPVALLLLCEMLIAYITVHIPQGPWPILNQGELALLYALIFFWLVAHGPGQASVDATRARYRLRET